MTARKTNGGEEQGGVEKRTGRGVAEGGDGVGKAGRRKEAAADVHIDEVSAGGSMPGPVGAGGAEGLGLDEGADVGLGVGQGRGRAQVRRVLVACQPEDALPVKTLEGRVVFRRAEVEVSSAAEERRLQAEEGEGQGGAWEWDGLCGWVHGGVVRRNDRPQCSAG